jgi:DNA mismatch repair protein MutS2
VLATTHYSGLKMYAANEEAVLNASVEFDEKTLQPTYRLLVGLAGASSGIEIALRFGFPDEIVRAANTHVGESARDATQYLRRIKNEAQEAEELRRALEEERAAVAEKYSSLDREALRRERERQSTFERELQKVVAEFEKRSRELVSKIEDRAERTKVEREAHRRAAELKHEAQRAARAASSTQGSQAATTTGRPVRVVRDGKVVEAADAASAPVEEDYRVAATARPIKVGDRVRLRSFGSIGIVDKLGNDEAEVRVKALRFREKLNNLELVEAVQPPSQVGRLEKMREAARKTEVHLSAPADARAELNVIGRSVDEAVDETDKFLDEAFLNSQQFIRIVHGHGTGALRRAIGDLLKNHPHVERFSQAPQGEGGAGATIVELKL